MESQDYLSLLRQNDLSSFEDPPGFDYAKELEQVRHFQVSLENQLGFRPSLDDQVQDSPHFAALGLKKMADQGPRAVIRFSKFGRMATIVDSEKLDREKLQLVLSELESHGYIYVPSAVVESPYDGQLQGIDTWMAQLTALNAMNVSSVIHSGPRNISGSHIFELTCGKQVRPLILGMSFREQTGQC